MTDTDTENLKSSYTSLYEAGEKEALRNLKLTHTKTDAFIAVETAADFRDAVFLLLSGYHVTVEPVAGVMSSFPRPTRTQVLHGFPQDTYATVIRKLRYDTNGERVSHANDHWKIHFYDTPRSIADGVRDIISSSAWKNTLYIDLQDIEPERGKVLTEMFLGICALLNRRAHRLLSICDIADLMEWIAIAAPKESALDCQVPYGVANWGFFVRREKHHFELEDSRPEQTDATRTVVCHSKPASDDLRAVLEIAAKGEHAVGLVNGALCANRLEGFRGASPDKGSLMPNYGLLPRFELDLSRVAGDEAGQWAACKLAGRSLIRDRKPLPEKLQPAWRENEDFRHLSGLQVLGVTPTRDHRNHALHAKIKMSDVLKQVQPKLVTAETVLPEIPGGTAVDYLNRLSGHFSASFSDAGVGADVPVGSSDVQPVAEWLDANWQWFVGANLS